MPARRASEEKSAPSAPADGSKRKKHSKTTAPTTDGSKRVKVIKKPRDPEIVEAEISELEIQLAKLSEEMAMPEVARDITRLVQVNNDYQQTESRLTELMNEWERAETGSTKR
jgi:hypothetical protein